MLEYLQMSTFEFTPQEKSSYITLYENRLQAGDIHDNGRYVALAAFDGQTTPNDVVSFAVQVENITEIPRLAQNHMATIAFDLILLDPDWQSAFIESQKAMLTDGKWDTAQPFIASNNKRFVSKGFLVPSLPDELILDSDFFKSYGSDLL